MDLSDLKPTSDTVTAYLYHPQTGEALEYDDGTQFTITVYAPHSKEYKESQQKNVDFFQKRKTKDNPTLMEMENAVISHMARITTEWDFLYHDEKPKLTYEKAREIYTDLFWVRDQIQEALDSNQGFTTV